VDNTQTTRFAISQSRAVFSPCNPMQAKQDIALEGACSLPSPLLQWKPLSSLLSALGLGIFRCMYPYRAPSPSFGYTDGMRLLGVGIGPLHCSGGGWDHPSRRTPAPAKYRELAATP
jgi:hypothetical protein